MMQQIVGVTSQHYSILSMLIPKRGLNQLCLLTKDLAQEWRDENLCKLGPNIQALLPHGPPCYFWDTILTYLDNFGNGTYLVDC